MACAWQDRTIGFAGVGTAAINFTKPASLAVGDTILIHVHSNNGTAPTFVATALPAGAGTLTEQFDTGGHAAYSLYIADGTMLAAQPATYTITASLTGGSKGGTLDRISGALASSQIDVVAQQANQATPVSPAVTTTGDNEFLWMTHGGNASSISSSLTAPGGVALRYSETGGSSIWLGGGDKTAATAGNTGNFTWTEGNVATDWWSVTWSIRNPSIPVTMATASIPFTVHTPVVQGGDVVLEAASIPFTVHQPSVVSRLAKWRAALAGLIADTQSATVVFVGDSVTEGYSAGPDCRETTMWISKTGNLIRDHVIYKGGPSNHIARYMPLVTGTGFNPLFETWPESGVAAPDAAFDPWVRSGSRGTDFLADVNSHGLGMRSVKFDASNTVTLPAALVPAEMTHVRVAYAANNSLTDTSIDVISDGVTTGNVPLVDHDTAEHLSDPIPITGGTDLTLSLNFGFSIGIMFVSGVILEDLSGSGNAVRSIDSGHGGWTAHDFATVDPLFLWADAIALQNPDLVVLNIGENDAQADPTATAQYNDDLTTMINAIEASCTALSTNGVPDIAFVADYFTDRDGTATYTSGQWDDFKDEMVAVRDGLPFARSDYFSLEDASPPRPGGFLGPFIGGPGPLTVDGTHPNADGSEPFAQGVKWFLAGFEEMSFTEGTVTLAGQDMSRTPGPVSRTFDSGVVALAGQDASLVNSGSTLPFDTGSVTLVGRDMTFIAGVVGPQTMTFESATLTLTGRDPTFESAANQRRPLYIDHETGTIKEVATPDEVDPAVIPDVGSSVSFPPTILFAGQTFTVPPFQQAVCGQAPVLQGDANIVLGEGASLVLANGGTA